MLAWEKKRIAEIYSNPVPPSSHLGCVCVCWKVSVTKKLLKCPLKLKSSLKFHTTPQTCQLLFKNILLCFVLVNVWVHENHVRKCVKVWNRTLNKSIWNVNHNANTHCTLKVLYVSKVCWNTSPFILIIIHLSFTLTNSWRWTLRNWLCCLYYQGKFINVNGAGKTKSEEGNHGKANFNRWTE